MRRVIRRAWTAALVAGAAACAPASRTASSGASANVAAPSVRRSADEIAADEIASRQFQNAYELVAALRPRWLSNRGTDSFVHDEVPVQVRVDDSRIGGVETLKSIAITEVKSIRFVDPIAAAARWGADHKNGAIVISTRR